MSPTLAREGASQHREGNGEGVRAGQSSSAHWSSLTGKQGLPVGDEAKHVFDYCED